jgi:hypothetical protein
MSSISTETSVRGPYPSDGMAAIRLVQLNNTAVCYRGKKYCLIIRQVVTIYQRRLLSGNG